VPAMILAVFAATGTFYTGFILPRVRELYRANPAVWKVLLLGAAIGLLAGLIPPTTWNDDAGRYSGLWNISRHFPAIADRSLFMAAGSCLGGLLMAAWFIALDPRSRWVWLAAWICFITAQT